MSRAWLGLIFLLAAPVSACDREPPPAPPPPPVAAPAKPAARHVQEAPPGLEAPPPPTVDISGMDEDAALVAVMAHHVAGDGDEERQALARFRQVNADTLLTKPVDLLPDYLRSPEAETTPEILQSSVQLIEQQVPADVRDAIRAKGRVKVLLVETCGADVGSALGIPNDYDEGSAPQYLDQARFDVAMEREKLKPMAMPADFRDMEGDRESVAALNRQLFELHRSGATKDILVVIDLSSDCAAGERQVKLVTEPPYESLRIMPAFYFAVCGKRAEDAWSPQQCRWWEDGQHELGLQPGTYYYVAKWPDGQEKRGRFIIDDLVTEAIEEGQETLTLDIKR